jgi:hypothetical protein
MMSSKILGCLMRIHLQEEFFSGPSIDWSRRAESTIEVYLLFSKLLNYYCLARSHFKFCWRNSFLVHRSLIIRVKGETLHIQTVSSDFSATSATEFNHGLLLSALRAIHSELQRLILGRRKSHHILLGLLAKQQKMDLVLGRIISDSSCFSRLCSRRMDA